MLGLTQAESGIWGHVSGVPKNDPEAMRKASENYARTGRGNYAAYLASGPSRIKEKRAEHRKVARDKAVAQFREQQPNIALREAELRTKWQEAEAKRRRQKIFSSTVSKSNYAIEYFQKHSASSFAKSIPRRSLDHKPNTGFDGSYLELAKSTLNDALTHQQGDGTISLLGAGIERERFAAQDAAGAKLQEISQSEDSYVGGVSTALWKLGFVEFNSEDQIRYGNGSFNPDIEWGEHNQTASLALDPDNELHQMLIPENSSFSNPRIEVDMASYRGDSRQEPSMSLRVVEAAAPVAIAA